jgi:hypothetical protein
MACRGVLFAIDDPTVDELLAASSDDEVMAIVERVEEQWAADSLVETDKAWDAMHHALADGAPRELAILGGRHLYDGDDYLVALVTKAEVPAVADALAAIDDGELRRRYDELVPHDYAPEYGDADREYTLGYFREVRAFYQRAAQARRAVIFTVDQ